MNRKVKIADATHAELLKFCRESLGLNLPPNTKVTTLEAKIAIAWGKDHINLTVDDVAEAAPIGAQPQPATAAQASGPKEGYVRIKIHITEEAGGDEAVQVSVEGKLMLVTRDKEVDIPYAYYDVLSHAIAHRYEMLPGGGMNPIPREVMLYPFQVIAGDINPPPEPTVVELAAAAEADKLAAAA